MSTEAIIEQIARYLCDLAHEDWDDLSREYWTDKAHEVLAIVREGDRARALSPVEQVEAA